MLIFVRFDNRFQLEKETIQPLSKVKYESEINFPFCIPLQKKTAQDVKQKVAKLVELPLNNFQSI
jgi:hypothetical protein